MSSIFALQVRAPADLLGFPAEAAEGDESPTAALFVELTDAALVAAAFSGPREPPAIAVASLDGAAWTVESGLSGDLRISYGDRAELHLDHAATRLLCAPADRADPRWQRALMDTGFATASLQRGNEALHAGAVVIDGKGVAIAGPSGAGKSTLLAELVSRGHPLLTDDILVLTDREGALLAHPGPPVMNLPSAASRPEHAVLAEFGDETWLGIADSAPDPVPLRAIYLLERAAGAHNAVLEVPAPATALLSLALDSGSDPLRQCARLDVLSAVAATVPVRRLVAGLDDSPSELADMIEC